MFITDKVFSFNGFTSTTVDIKVAKQYASKHA